MDEFIYSPPAEAQPIPSNDPFSNPENPVEDDVASAEKTACVVIVIIFIALILVGAGVWYYIKHRGIQTPPPVAVTESSASVVKEKTDETGKTTIVVKADTNLISAEKGGTVTYADSDGKMVKLIIPADALDTDTKIEIERVSVGIVTDLYHLKPDGLKFLKPATIVIPYKESGLAADETPYDIQLRYWFKEKYWIRVLDFTVDKEEKTLSAQVTEL